MSGDNDAGATASLLCKEEYNNSNHDHDDDGMLRPDPSFESPLPTASRDTMPPSAVIASKELRMSQQDDDTSDEEEIMAAVVVDDDDDDEHSPFVVEAVATVEEEEQSPSVKRRKKTNNMISQDVLKLAADAREMLIETVPRLPVAVSDSHVVRSFGQIRIESSSNEQEEFKFSTPNALYPVGFSCDRYEFSPVHGRVLKMRCTIFDGSKLVEKQRQCGVLSPNTLYPNGPVFRVMWGQGVDDYVDNSDNINSDGVDYPYDVYTASAPISGHDDEVDAVAVPFLGNEDFREVMEPEEGMRVKVRFERDAWYTGTVTSVELLDDDLDDNSSKSSRYKNGPSYEITIRYDDGSVEDTVFPDSDISIYLPSSEDVASENGIIEIDQLHGKPVTCVVGSSPLEAWGKALVKLGLIDEIMLQMAVDAVVFARVEGREEAMEKMEKKKLAHQHARARTLQKQADAESAADIEVKENTKVGVGTNAKDVTASSPQEQDGEAPKEHEEVKTRDASHAQLSADNDAPTSKEGVKADTSMDDADGVEKVDVDDAMEVDTVNHKEVSNAPSTVLENGKDTNGEHEKDGDDADEIDVSSEMDGFKEEVGKEPPSESEQALRIQVEALENDLSILQASDQDASIALADARIGALGPFFINPFQERGFSSPQQLSWLATVVRKEKSKMGSTGNKRKIVTATDLLERNGTFFNEDIEALLEGLPGSELCPTYVFKAFRAGGAAAISQGWIHEAKLRQEREREKQLRSASSAKAKASQLRERELKRKRRDDERDARKKQKQKVEDEKKQVRAEERMSRLKLQVEDRLFKEACFQREKVVTLFAKSLGKEFGVRQKAAESVSAQAILDARGINTALTPLVGKKLPPLGRLYDKDVVRLWDFFTTFGSSFLEWGYLPSLPTLDSLQDAIDTVRGEGSTSKSKSEAVEQLVKLAIVLCHPIGASLTKFLFGSIISLNPLLQKDFGAAFFLGVNATTNAKAESDGSTAIMPVNAMTWQEIARQAFLSDALGEVGLGRQEGAHLLRGYRSVGHPNSKEAKRLRRSEDFSVALLRQELSQRALNRSSAISEETLNLKIRLHAPSSVSASQKSWLFFLHNVKSLQNEDLKGMKKTIQMGIAALESTDPKPADANAFLSDLRRSLDVLGEIKSTGELSASDLQICKKARQTVLRILDKATGEVFSSDSIGQVVAKDGMTKTAIVESPDDAVATEPAKLVRQRMGLIRTLGINEMDYKLFAHAREEYMAEALRLKEELNQEEDEEDDDDDELEGKEKGSDKMDTSNAAKDAKNLVDNGSTNATEAPNETTAPKQNESNGQSETVSSEGPPGNDAKTLTEAVARGETTASDAQESDEQIKSADKLQHEGNTSSEIVATVVENGAGKSNTNREECSMRIGRVTPYDEFTGDIPTAPEVIRRCLAVLRALCQSRPAEPFLYPVDPQANPGYYEAVLRPMCLREVGIRLRDAASKHFRNTEAGIDPEDEKEIEAIVAQFARNARLIMQNCGCYEKAGPMIVASGEELIRIFERLFLDWVLSPKTHLPPLEFLDDDRCVEHHSSDEEALILLCDGCEGKYNMGRLDPPLLQVPKGDWFCPRCLKGHSWEDVDPRIGKKVVAGLSTEADICAETPTKPREGIVRRCILGSLEGENTRATLLYDVDFGDGWIETWTLSAVDKALSDSGLSVEPVRCIEAVAESPGYGAVGIDRGVVNDLVPMPLNPGVSDTAAQSAISSSVFRDTLAGSSALRLASPEELTASQWLRLLILLVTKCSNSEIMQSLASQMESTAAEKMAARLQESNRRIEQVQEILPCVSDDEGGNDSCTTAVAVAVARHGDSATSAEELVKTVMAESIEGVDASAIAVDASAIEVVTDLEQESVAGAEATAGPLNGNKHEQPTDEASKARRNNAIGEKKKRQKIREESIVAFCVKNELRPIVASFDEDVVSQLIESTFSAKEPGLDFASSRSRGKVCDFCGLSDLALGTPLVRAPNSSEWNELMPHTARSRRTVLLAEHPDTRRLATVKVRIAGEIVSTRADESYFDDTPDGAMTEFLPRNDRGFQHELRCLDESGLPFVTGSLSAHECCAAAAHDARKERILKEHSERDSYLVEWGFGRSCGRTLSLGRDAMGRTYWKFNADSSLFVCEDAVSRKGNIASGKAWHRFTKPEEIASLLLCLGSDSVVPELRRTFPDAAQMLKTGKWSAILQQRHFARSHKPNIAPLSPKVSSGKLNRKESTGPEVEEDDQPYEELEDVMVESSCGKLLWNAKIIGVSHSNNSGKVNGYRVHYKDWSSRFDEWVDPFRVVEPNENNIEVQAEMMEEAAASRGIPPQLENMDAADFVYADDRARGSAALPNFAEISKVAPWASSDERTFGLAKAAILLVEAALPEGAVDNSEDGSWSPDLASEWRSVVKSAKGPSGLMRCVILLEENIASEWMEVQYNHLLQCLPFKWKAINEASVSSLALRIFLLDKAIHFDEIPAE